MKLLLVFGCMGGLGQRRVLHLVTSFSPFGYDLYFKHEPDTRYMIYKRLPEEMFQGTRMISLRLTRKGCVSPLIVLIQLIKHSRLKT